jgi:hypothetical protein
MPIQIDTSDCETTSPAMAPRLLLIGLGLFLLLIVGGIAWGIYQGLHTEWVTHPGLYDAAVSVENVDGIGGWWGYARGQRCLVDLRETFTPLGTVGGETYMRYSSPHRHLAECYTGTMVRMSPDRLQEERQRIATYEAAEQSKARLSVQSRQESAP